ncbi:MAG: thioredoxin family protein [Desulfotomaculaceae bacterium]|nr:thioredoxin family protein [Desulfotomaculaceae bacterium]MDD4766734.1 thioredoxin family protein [Desulfotomaculaceae bacterium]
MEIKVLGAGCPRCHQLMMEVINTLAEMDLDAGVNMVEDKQLISSYNVNSLPAIVINGKVKTEGKIPNRKEIKKLIITENEL